MGTVSSKDNFWLQPDVAPPPPVFTPKFDPLLGFPKGRKERTIKTTKEEMESAHIEPELRDYCIDSWMEFVKCRQKNFPLVYKCKHQRHAYHDCEYEDHLIRFKELEREKRLQKVADKKAAKEAA